MIVNLKKILFVRFNLKGTIKVRKMKIYVNYEQTLE